MTWPAPTSTSATIRAGDDDREVALELLRQHWLAGRLTLAEYEARCDEVGQARFVGDLERAVRELPIAPPAPVPNLVQPGNGAAITSCVLGVTSLAALVLTVGLLFFLTLPFSVAAWALGRRGRRHATSTTRGLYLAGEVTGLIGTVIALLMLSACAMLVSALF
jgi:hypothetical protein